MNLGKSTIRGQSKPGQFIPPWLRPRPPLKPKAIAVGAGAVVALLCLVALGSRLGLAWDSADHLSESLSQISGPFALVGGFLAYLGGDRLGVLWSALRGQTGAYALALVGMMSASALLFFVGRMLIGPFWMRYGPRPGPPKLNKDGRLPLYLRTMMLLLPPPSFDGRAPVIERFGLIIAIIVHLLPPPGPWFFRLIVDVLLGTSKVPLRRLMLGTALGLVGNIVAREGMARAGISPPSPPSGWTLVVFLIAPILLTLLIKVGQLFLRQSKQTGDR